MKIAEEDIGLIQGIFSGTFQNQFCWAKSIYNFKSVFHSKKNTLLLLDNSETAPIKYKFIYFCNKDKTIRWLIPESVTKPRFLKFYNVSNVKSKVFAFAIKIAYQFNLQKIISSGSIEIDASKNNALNDLLSQLNCKAYSIFLGTVGPNRKVIIEVESEDKENYFIKIPVNESGLCLIKNEKETLSKLENVQNYAIPTIKLSTENIIIQTNNFADKKMHRPQKFNKLLENFVNTNYQNNSTKLKLSDSEYYNATKNSIEALKLRTIKPELSLCFSKLLKLNEKIDNSENYQFHFCHGDFTSWNILINSKELYVYDWELSQNLAPLYFDFFHFHFQKGILQDRLSFNEIKSNINTQILKGNIYNKNDVLTKNWKNYLSLYLWHICAYYINIYQKQDKLHEQVLWLTNVWNDGLKWSLNIKKESLDRIEFAKIFFKFLNTNKTRFGWLKSKQIKLSELQNFSDLDILIDKKDYKEILNFIKTHNSVITIKEIRQSFMSTIEVFLYSGEILHFDLIWKFKRKSKVYINANSILENTIYNDEGIKILNVKDDFNYCLKFYQLNNNGIPTHYLEYFKANETYNNAFKYVNSFYTGNANKKLKMELVEEINKMPENKGIHKIFNFINYLGDILKRVKHGKGIIISFSGVDGAGKSTVLESTKKLFETKYRRKTIVLRHRPSLLPILSSYKYGKAEAEKKASETLPRTGSNKSVIGSFFRFMYYYTDYFFGQWVIYYRYVLKGYIVLYDRYYFDFINDPKRTNLNLSNKLPILLSKFIRKPDFNFLLTAPPKVILKRKQELSENAIKSLTTKYKNYFSKLSSEKRGNFITLENIDLKQTLTQVENEIKIALTS